MQGELEGTADIHLEVEHVFAPGFILYASPKRISQEVAQAQPEAKSTSTLRHI